MSNLFIFLFLVDLTLLCAQYTNLEILVPVNFFGDFKSNRILEQIQLCCQYGNFGQLS